MSLRTRTGLRNPIRLKNLRLRFLPQYAIGLALLVVVRPSPQSLVIGAVPIVLGVALRSWGAGHLVKNHCLTISGPYAHVRHPLYLGTILIASGFAFVVGGVWTLALLLLLLPWFFLSYFPRKDRVEGDRLLAIYGEAFGRYREEVPALVPSLFQWTPPGDLPEGADVDEPWRGGRYSDNNELGTLLAVVAGLVLFAVRAVFPPLLPL